ncbi:MAG: C39 family peptidase [Candidatus Yanofskybacteria bacterium]|nr:C39 family peptidase [Candidatus Yanofskybacteria bacterium]
MRLKTTIIALGILFLGGWFLYGRNPQKTVLNTATPSARSTPTPTVSLPLKILLDVPFTAQAPLGHWEDPRQQDGCEEASILMAIHWANRTKFTSLEEAEQSIITLAEYKNHPIDTSAADTANLMRDYFNYSKIRVVYNITRKDIQKELAAGNLVLVPAWGQKLLNPNFTPPGPVTHMLVIKGYDDGTQEFITNDPGTRKGEGFRYNYSVMQNAFFDYPTGDHELLITKRSAMIVIEKD